MVKRSWDGRIAVTPPDGQEFTVTAGGQGEAVPDGLDLAFRDSRTGAKAGPDPRPPASPASPSGASARRDQPNPLL
jgi:hypothetical protein